MAVGYFVVLPPKVKTMGSYQSLPTMTDEEDIPSPVRVVAPGQSLSSTLKRTTQRIKPLVIPYMAPLFLVYVSEYTINQVPSIPAPKSLYPSTNSVQGVTPTLLFPLSQMPFHSIRDAYPTYQTLYQLGVFISRSSSLFFRMHNIYLPSILQFCILCLLILQSLFVIIPSIYPIFVIIFVEGILGGLVYVNAFQEVREREHEGGDREFALGAGRSLFPVSLLHCLNRSACFGFSLVIGLW
jgi:battenin